MTLAAQVVLQKTFLHIVATCRVDHIDVIPLKGIFLAEYIYPGVGARPMSDLDILVDQALFEPAIDAMRRNGFTCDLDFLAQRGVDLPSGVTLEDRDKNIRVDVHYSLLNNHGIRGLLLSPRKTRRLNIEAMDNVVRRKYIDREIAVLSPPFFLLSLMLHHYTHNFAGISWFLDAVYFARTLSESDWAQFTALLESYGLERMAALYFALAAKNLGCEPASFLPEDVVREAAPGPFDAPLLRAAMNRGRLGPLSALALVPSPARQVQGLARALFPSREYLEAVSHKPLSGLDYFQEMFNFQRRLILR